MVIPFLSILFEKEPIVAVEPELGLSVNSIKEYFNYIVSEIITTEGQIAALLFICILVVSTSFFKNLFRYAALWFITPARNGVSKDLRNNLFDKLLSLPLSFLSEKRKGDMITRMSSDVQEIEWSILNTLEAIIKEPVTIVVYLITLFVISPTLTLFILILLPITGLIIGRIGRKLKLAAQQGQTKLSELISIIEESISGLRIIKAFNAEKNQSYKFHTINKSHFHIITGMIRRRDLSSPLSEFLGTAVVVLVLYIGTRMVLIGSGGLEAETFIGFIIIFSQLIQPSKSFSAAYYQIQKGIASAERVEKILDADIAITEAPDAVALTEFKEGIEYRNVSFAYEHQMVLKDINVHIKKGMMVALVGQSGSGKSTFADLLPRFYDVIEGGIFIDGIDLREYKIKDLRNSMGIVSQEPILFNDTIFNNIAYGKEDATEADVINAAKIANAHDFIEKQENGYNTIIGDRGSKLSGGERQRLTIARAVLKNPPILILDEATSSLDTESERLVQDALYKLMQNRTSIVIAHRLSTIQNADEILVMQKGQIMERGNHLQLLEKKGIYQKLVEMQAF